MATAQVAWTVTYPILSADQPHPGFSVNGDLVFILDFLAYATFPEMPASQQPAGGYLTGVYAVAFRLQDGAAMWATLFPSASAAAAAPAAIFGPAPDAASSCAYPQVGTEPTSFAAADTGPQQPLLLLCPLVDATTGSQTIVPLDAATGNPDPSGSGVNLSLVMSRSAAPGSTWTVTRPPKDASWEGGVASSSPLAFHLGGNEPTASALGATSASRDLLVFPAWISSTSEPLAAAPLLQGLVAVRLSQLGSVSVAWVFGGELPQITYLKQVRPRSSRGSH